MKGQTIHGMFKIPFGDQFDPKYFEQLTPEKQAELRIILQRAFVLIIDEISMVCTFLHFLLFNMRYIL